MTRGLLSIAVLLALTASARGAPTVVRVTPYDLAAGKLAAPPNGKNITQGNCVLSFASNHWTFDQSKCLDDFGTPFTQQDFTFRLENGQPLGGTYVVFDTGGVQITSAPPMVDLAVPTGAGFKVIALDVNGVSKDPDAKMVDGGPVAARDAEGTVYELTLTKMTKTVDDKKIPPKPSCPVVDAWCPTESKDEKTICIDATNGFEPTVEPEGYVVLPNKPLYVIVRHRTDHGVKIQQQGTRGLFEAGVTNLTGGLLDKTTTQVENSGLVCVTTSHARFAPRKPGSADVKVELRDIKDGAKVVADHTLELEVDTTYAGAIRLGFASIHGDAVDRAYESQVAPGSGTREVVSTEAGDVNIEVIVGISAYVVDLIAEGGRRYASRPRWSYFVPSPYVAIGVVTPENDDVKFIPSLHLGLEWEISKSFAVGFGLVARRVTRLSDGLDVGSPVSAMTSLTEERYEWGGAFTFSVSPEFFQVAVGKP